MDKSYCQKNNYSFVKIRAIIGLGNPGTKFLFTRHNIGFRLVDAIINNKNLTWQENNLMQYVNDRDFVQGGIYIIKPMTFMNESGKVVPFLQKKGIKPDEILVIHDELEKSFGSVSIAFSGSARGHNGLRSIINMIGKDFWRLRIGIGRPVEKSMVGTFVLQNFSDEEESCIPVILKKSLDLVYSV